MGTSDEVWRGPPPPSVTHSPETPKGGGEGAAEKEAGGPGRAHHPVQAELKEQHRRWLERGRGVRRGGSQDRVGKGVIPDHFGGAWISACCRALVPGEGESVRRELLC